MTLHHLETDYLVVGAGAMGLAFVDEVITRDRSARILMVDRRARPGGHWNDAYGFVSLHQPAAYYGVNSLPLGDGGAALASGDEVMAYFGKVMHKLLATGRVIFHGLCEYEGQGRLRSLAERDRVYQVQVRRKTVDATYMNVEVPATTAPKYAVAPGVALVPVNGLVEVRTPPSGYVIIGAGKTAIDAVLFLLDKGVDPEHITWIISNDAWLLRRELIQPGRTVETFMHQLEMFAGSSTIDEVFLAGESRGLMLRLDTAIRPTKFRCATVSDAELAQLRRVRDLVRLGRVVRIEADTIVLENGTVPTDGDRLYVDCTADGLAKRPVRPVFDGSTITLQSLLMCQQVFSAALIGYLETRFDSDTRKNALSQVVPHPEWSRDYVTVQLVSNENLDNWLRDLDSWLQDSRLFFAHHESRLKLLVAAFRARRLQIAAERQMRVIAAREFATDKSGDGRGEPDREPVGSLEVRSGALRFSALTAGMAPVGSDSRSTARPCVLCLHGFPDNARSFRLQLPALANQGYRAIAVTMRGYEPSSQPADSDYAIATMARDVIAWLDHLGEDRVHLVGHDWGAAVTYAAGALAPDRFHSLTTIAVPHTAHFTDGIRKVPGQALKSWYMFFFQLRGLSEHALERDDWALIKRLWRAWSPDFILPGDEWARLRATFEAPGVKNAMLSYYRQNATPSAVLGVKPINDFTTVPVPTLAVTGADDGCIDTRLYEHLFRDEDFPGGYRIERIPGAGHFVHQEKPGEFNRLLLDWLAEHSV